MRAERERSHPAGVASTEAVGNRLAICDEAVRLAGQAGDYLLALRARIARMGALLELGHMDAVRIELEICDRMTREETARALGLQLWRGGPTRAGPERSPLSRREREVARLVAAGLGNREVAEQLFISKRTVETHVENIRRKVGASCRAGIMSWVLRDSEGTSADLT